MTTSGIESWLVNFVKETEVSPKQYRCFYVMSTAHFHGIWDVLLKFSYETHEVKQDFADALLEEAFYLGFDYGDDWSNIMVGVNPSIMLDWRVHKRDGLIISSYTPSNLWPLLFKEFTIYKTIFETQEDREGEVKVLDALGKQLGRRVYQMGKLSRWDGYLPSLELHNPKPEMIFEIKRRSYNWDFFEREGLILTSKKFEGMLQHFRTGIHPILIVEADGEIRWCNVGELAQDNLRYGKAKCDRVDVPHLEDVVVIAGLVFKPLSKLKGMQL